MASNVTGFGAVPMGPAQFTGPGHGARLDGTQKSTGYFGPLPYAGGSTSTELSGDAEIDGKPLLYPLLVPTMPRAYIDSLLGGGKATKEMHDIAIDHALGRVKAGKSPFWGQGDAVSPLPPVETLTP